MSDDRNDFRRGPRNTGRTAEPQTNAPKPVEHLIRLYRECYKARYDFNPAIQYGETSRWFGELIKQAGIVECRVAMYHFFKMSDEAILKWTHSPKAFHTYFNKILADATKDRKSSGPPEMLTLNILEGRGDNYICEVCGRSNANLTTDGKFYHAECRSKAT